MQTIVAVDVVVMSTFSINVNMIMTTKTKINNDLTMIVCDHITTVTIGHVIASNLMLHVRYLLVWPRTTTGCNTIVETAAVDDCWWPPTASWAESCKVCSYVCILCMSGNESCKMYMYVQSQLHYLGHREKATWNQSVFMCICIHTSVHYMYT